MSASSSLNQKRKLLGKTEEAKRMRDKVHDLLWSESDDDKRLAMDMMKIEGVPFEAFSGLWELQFRHDLEFRRDAIIAKELLLFWVKHQPPAISNYVQNQLSLLKCGSHRPRYGLFRGDKFFELLLQERVLGLKELEGVWKTDVFYWQHSDLNQFLLRHAGQLDLNGFIARKPAYRDLHCPRVRVLFESCDRSFQKEAFLREYVKGQKLDLSNTGIREVPSFFANNGIRVIDIRGTEITELAVSFDGIEVLAKKSVRTSLFEKQYSRRQYR